MQVFNSIKDLKTHLAQVRAEGKTVGFVPTMGALHAGHISLVEQARSRNDIVTASIFVNPTQFNDPRDLLTYPRREADDCAMLDKAGCDVVFIPSVEEMYPEPDTRVFALGAVAEVMEGAHRKGHFNGVAQIVSKLFDAVQPDEAFFGEKDFQQIAVIRAMCRLLRLSVNIVACPIVREADGLAMSSRNIRLTPSQRQIAPRIAQTLKESVAVARTETVDAVRRRVIETLDSLPEMRVEYFEIVDGETLQPLSDWRQSACPTGCIAVYCGEVRLIDNIIYN